VGLATAGCATSNCHGGAQTAGKAWKTSAFVFLERDPHTHAFDVLFDGRSREMIRRLARPNNEDLESDSTWYLQELETRCLSCHATPLPGNESPLARHTGVDTAYQHYALGVSCESCHGKASQWLGKHLSEAWSNGEGTDKASFGFRELEKPAIAAQTCVGCHIGTPGKSQVTHDLIAAGHPRLDFDFAAWFASLPPHWDGSFTAAAEFHSQAWNIGQRETLNARLRLVAAPHTQQTEFAHMDCFACHHALKYPQDFTAGSGHYVEGTQLSFGSPWKVFEHLQPEPVDKVNLQIAQYLAGSRPPYPFFYSDAGQESNSQQLARHLAEYPPVASWDELTGWYYAATAVLRDAESAAKQSPDTANRVEMARTALAMLRGTLEPFDELKQKPSRYVAPKGNVQTAREAFDAAKAALEELGR
jgi:hypothetical protein